MLALSVAHGWCCGQNNYVDEVIVMDDGSTDDTVEVPRSAGATVLRQGRNLGKGSAIQRILSEAKKMQLDVVRDADGQHGPGEIPCFIEAVSAGHDLVIGSRQAESHKTPAYPRFGQTVLLRGTRILTRARLTDSESGFRALSPRTIELLILKENGFATEVEMIAGGRRRDLRLRKHQLPISILQMVQPAIQFGNALAYFFESQ